MVRGCRVCPDGTGTRTRRGAKGTVTRRGVKEAEVSGSWVKTEPGSVYLEGNPESQRKSLNGKEPPNYQWVGWRKGLSDHVLPHFCVYVSSGRSVGRGRDLFCACLSAYGW